MGVQVLDAMKFQHTAARRRLINERKQANQEQLVSTHSRPKAAEAGRALKTAGVLFQHTAARRRLNRFLCNRIGGKVVSTHSRPKAAD